jgi:hypothetical protein
MTIETFWQAIDEARQSVVKFTDVPARLIELLSQMDEKEIIDFGSHFQNCMHLSYDANLWLAAVVIIGGCGDDKFTDFRCWLIAQGRDVFEAALADPDSLAKLENFDGDHGLPIMIYMGSVDNKAFCKRVAGDIRDFDACERYESLFPLRKYPTIRNQELVNTSDEDAKVLMPQLAAKFPVGIHSQR